MRESQKRVGETAEAIELRVSGENSILGALAACVGISLTDLVRWAYWWNSTEETPEDITDQQALLDLNTDFRTHGMSSNEVTALVSAWQAGAISQDTMFELFRRSEILPDGRKNEEEAALVKRVLPSKDAKEAKKETGMGDGG